MSFKLIATWLSKIFFLGVGQVTERLGVGAQRLASSISMVSVSTGGPWNGSPAHMGAHLYCDHIAWPFHSALICSDLDGCCGSSG